MTTSYTYYKLYNPIYMVDARRHEKRPLAAGTLDFISPVDSLEVSAFDREYGKDLKKALRKPRTVKNSIYTI